MSCIDQLSRMGGYEDIFQAVKSQVLKPAYRRRRLPPPASSGGRGAVRSRYVLAGRLGCKGRADQLAARIDPLLMGVCGQSTTDTR